VSLFLRREVLGLLRARWAFWLLVATTAATSLLPLIYWPQAQSEKMMRGAEAFQVLFVAELFAVLLIVPAAAGGAIAGERERRTFELLFSSPLPARTIVASKLLAPLLLVLLGLSATLPAAGALYLHGGIEFESIFVCYLVVGAAAVVASLGSLAQSARSRSSVQAVTRALIWSAMWSSGPFILLGVVAFGALSIYRDIFLLDASKPRDPSFIRRALVTALDSWTRFLLLGFLLFAGVMLALPVTVMLVAAGDHLAIGLSPFSAACFELEPLRGPHIPAWIIYLPLAAVISLVQWRKLLRAVAEAQIEGEEPQLAIEIGPVPVRPGASPRSYAAGLVLSWGEKGLRLFSNPLLLQELRTQFHGNAFYRQALFWGTAVVCFLLSTASINANHVFAAAAFIGLVFLPPAGAVGFAREVEGGNLDFLRSSALSHREVLNGKLAAALLSALSPCVAAMGVGFVRAQGQLWSDAIKWGACVGWLIDLLVRGAALWASLALLVVISSVCSAFTRRSIHAILLSYGLAFALQIGGALVATYGLRYPTDRSGWLPNLPWLLVEAASPLVLFMGHRSWENPGLGWDCVDIILSIALEAALAAGLYTLARWRLKRVFVRGL